MITLGVNTTNIDREASIIADLDLAHSLGFTWVRTSQEMHWGYSPFGSYALDVLGRYAQACSDRGLHLIQCCQGMPASMARGGRAGHYGPKDATSARLWGDWFGECAAIVASTGGITSCGNEWDNYGWDTTPSAHDCATLHIAALAGRDARAPGATFATCEMAPGVNPNPLTFLQAINDAAPGLLKEAATMVGWHPYTDPRWPADYNALWNTNHRMRDVHTWLAQQGHGTMKIMGGEWGVANGPNHNPQALKPQAVADYVRTQYLPSFQKMAADGVRFGPMCWYTLRDGGSADWPGYMGCVDLHGVEKPVATVFKTYNAGGTV